MNFLKAFCIIAIVALSNPVHATLIDNGAFSSDDTTGLDWLDLSISIGQSFNSAETENTGWRYATNAEVEGLFGTMFEGYYSHRSDDYSFSQDYTHYADLVQDASNWWSLFGGVSANSLGMYKDENDIIRTLGVSRYYSTGWFVYGKNYTKDLSDQADNQLDSYGTLLVRNTDGFVGQVPEPAMTILFSIGLAGLATSRIKKRKSNISVL